MGWCRWTGRVDERFRLGSVQAALDLVGAGPPALAGVARTGARLAADRGVALIVERVVGQIVLEDVVPHVALGPIGQRSGLPEAVLGVPAQPRGVGALG